MNGTVKIVQLLTRFEIWSPKISWLKYIDTMTLILFSEFPQKFLLFAKSLSHTMNFVQISLKIKFKFSQWKPQTKYFPTVSPRHNELHLNQKFWMQQSWN